MLYIERLPEISAQLIFPWTGDTLSHGTINTVAAPTNACFKKSLRDIGVSINRFIKPLINCVRIKKDYGKSNQIIFLKKN
jgi:hypothetical protein